MCKNILIILLATLLLNNCGYNPMYSKNVGKKYNIEDMIKGDVIFCATGVTSGDLAKGVKDLGNEYEVNTFVLHKSQKIIKSVTNIYNK